MLHVLLLLGAAAGPAAPAQGLRILSLMTVDVPSHHLWMAPLSARLAELGHRVHAVDIKEIQGGSASPGLTVSVLESAFTLVPGFAHTVAHGNVLQRLRVLLEYGLRDCAVDLRTPTMKRLLADAAPRRFDVVLVDYAMTDCLLPFAHLFDCPAVVLTPFPANYWMDLVMGNPTLPALQPLSALQFDTPMTLPQRVVTALLHAYVYYVVRWELEPATDRFNGEVFGPDTPPVRELRRRVALALINEIPGVTDSARPLTPSIVPVGGMHIKPANLSSIPQVVKEWLDNAMDGFIFFSFGSSYRGANIDSEKRTAFIQAFSMLKQRVLWKYEEEDIISTLPPNVRVEPWLPQNDILAHPNIRLFISHGGGLSSQEALYHGVPVLGIPLVLDQHANVRKLGKLGMGRQVDFSSICTDRIIEEIQEMISNSTYGDTARRRSRVMRDQKEPPLERAAWWVQHVARHGGAPHLRSPALDLAWPQIVLVDVIAVLLSAVLAALIGALGLLRALGRLRRRLSVKSSRKTD